MKIKFTKTGKKDNWISVQKTNGDQISFPWVAKAAGIPHDLTHFVVESTLKIKGGFWSAIQNGIQFDEATEMASRAARGVFDKNGLDENGLKLQQTEALVSAFTNTLLWTKTQNLEDCINEINRCCLESKVDLPKLDEAKIVDTLMELSQMSQRWNKLSPGESIEVSFDLSEAPN